MKAILRHIRISPKKANLVAGLVRRKSVAEALDILKFTPKKAAPLLAKVIKSAAANAKNNFKQKEELLFIEEILVTKGATLKRYVPISRGRSHPIHKMTSHITVRVGIKEPEIKEDPKKAAPKAKKAETKKEEAKEDEPKVEKTTEKKPEAKAEKIEDKK